MLEPFLPSLNIRIVKRPDFAEFITESLDEKHCEKSNGLRARQIKNQLI